MNCPQEICSVLPLHQRMYRRASDFFRERPAAVIMGVGIPLLRINLVATALVGLMSWRRSLPVTAAAFGVVAGAAAAVLSPAVGMASVAVAERAVNIGREGRDLTITRAVAAAIGGITGLSTLMHGGGFFLSTTMAAVSAYATYATRR